MKSKKKWISILVLVAFICTIVPLPVLAAEMQDSLLVTEPNKQPLLSGAVTTENSTAQGVQLVEQNKTLSEATAAIAQEGVCGETLTWTLTADGVLTISGTGAMNQAFDRSLRSQVKELVFEEGVTELYDYAFESCTALTKITFPSSMEIITKGAFSSCTALTNVILPNGVIEIGDYAFIGCQALTSVYIPESVTTIGNFPFGNCEKVAIYGVAGSQAEAYALSRKIPFSTATAGADGAIIYLEQDKTVIPIGDTVNLIAKDSTGEVMPVTWSIADSSILEIITESGDGSSIQLKGLNPGITVVTAASNDAVTTRTVEVLGNSGQCGETATWDLTDGVLTISGTGAITNPAWLQMRENITSVVMDDGITEICNGAFEGTKIKSIVIPDSITVIGDYAFCACEDLSSVTLSSNLTTINQGVFLSCPSLTSVYIPESVTTIGKDAFFNGAQLAKVFIPATVTNIDDTAFAHCPNLTICGLENSYAESYAVKNNISFSVMTSDDMNLNISVIQDKSEFAVGDTVNLTAKVTGLVDGESVSEFYWEIEDTTVLELINQTDDVVNSSSTALMRGLKEGTTIVTVATDKGGLVTKKIKVGYSGTGGIGEASGTCGENVAWSFADGVLTISGTGAMTSKKYNWQTLGVKKVIIEDGVTSIVETAFAGCSDLTEVVMSDSVTEMGMGVFTGCAALKSVSLSNNLTSIAENTFYNCSSLEEIVIPNTVTSIGDYAFNGCSGLKNILLPENLLQIGNNAFSYCTALKNIKIPLSLREIGKSAFAECDSLIGLIIPDGVTTIDQICYGCDALLYVFIPESVVTINKYAFRYCEKVVLYGKSESPAETYAVVNKIPFYIASIDDEGVMLYVQQDFIDFSVGDIITLNATALDNMGQLDSTTIKWSIADTSILKIINQSSPALAGTSEVQVQGLKEGATVVTATTSEGLSVDIKIKVGIGVVENLIWNIENGILTIRGIGSILESPWASRKDEIQNIVIEEGIEIIGQEVFKDYSALVQVSLPSTVKYINESAFAGCTALTTINLPENLLSIRESAFADCTMLKNIELPKTLIELGEAAFTGCSSLTQISIPGGIKKLKYATFAGCTSLTNVLIEQGVISLDAAVFARCSSLQIIEMPDDITTIGVSTFNGCTSLETVKLPEQLNMIDNYLFENCSSLTSIVIPDNITTINKGAFENCISLSEVIIGQNVNNIQESAFENCTTLANVITPDSLVEIGSSAFAGCTSLNNIIFGENLREIGRGAFEQCTSLINVEIPNLVESIGTFAFIDCIGLETISFGNNVSTIGQRAFSGCSALKTINLPEKITTIAVGTFDNCTALESVSLGNNVAMIEEYAFYHCDSLQELIIPDSVTMIGEYAFYSCEGLQTLILGKGLSELAKNSFAYCESLTSVTFSSSSTLETIGENAFIGCITLSSVVLPDSIVTIADSAFQDCREITTVTFGQNIARIGNKAFLNCSSLEEVLIPDSVIELGNSVFEKCTNLFIVKIGNGLKELPFATFKNCTSIENIIIPSNINKIGVDAFVSCSSLESVLIPESVTAIGGQAFYGCEQLKSLTIPDSVTSLGDDAFAFCTALQSIEIGDGITNWDGFFSDYMYNKFSSSLESIVIGESITEIPDSIFSGCILLNNVVMGGDVTSIGNYAFKGCVALTNITLPESLTSIGNSTFYGCESLSAIAIPDTTTSIGKSAFFNCSSLETVDTGDGIDNLDAFKFLSSSTGDIAENVTLKNVTIGKNIKEVYGFKNCKALSNIVWHSDIKKIRAEAFSGCSSLTTIDIPESTKNIGNRAFDNCTGLTSITIPGNDVLIESSAFSGCASLPEINIPGDNVEIGYGAFKDCPALKSVFVDGDNVFLGDYAFSKNSSLSKVNISGENVTIGWNTFLDCGSLSTVIFPDVNVINLIDENAFKNCISLTNIMIPKVDTLIGESAFAGCTGLTDVVIENVNQIGYGAFIDCSSLETVTILEGDTKLGDMVFDNCKALIAVNLAGVESIPKDAFESCHQINKAVFGNKIQILPSIHSNNLREVWIGYNVTGDIDLYNYYAFLPDDDEEKQLIHIYGYTGSYAEKYVSMYDDNKIHPFIFHSVGQKPGTETGSNGTTIDIYTENLTCQVDNTLDITAMAIYPIDLAMADRGNITWEIGDTSILEQVSVETTIESGKSVLRVKGLQEGETTVTARTTDGASVTEVVKVTKSGQSEGSEDIVGVDGTEIHLDAKEYNGYIDGIMRIEAIVTYPQGEPEVENIQWSINDKSVAEIVDAASLGLDVEPNVVWVKGKKEGTTRISVSTSDDAKSSRIVTITTTDKQKDFIAQHLDFVNGSEYALRMNSRWAIALAEGLDTSTSNIAEGLYHVLNSVSELLNCKSLSVFENPYDAILANLILEKMDSTVKDYSIRYEATLLKNINNFEKFLKMNCEDWDAHPEYKTYLEKLFSDPKAVQKEHAEFYNLLINTLGQDGNRKIENFLDSSLFAYDKISKGIDAVNVYSNVVEWVSDCVKYDSLAKAFVDTNNEYKAVLYEAVNYMETEDVWYGMQYKAALEKYAAYMNDDKMVEVFLDYCLTNGATRIADVFGGAIETGIVSYFTEALGLTPQAASYIFAAIEAYKVGWSIGDAITHNGDVIDCRELIRANYHLEYAIGKLTNHYESELNKQQTYNTAVYFDEAYSILQVTEVFSMKTYVKYLVAQETSWVQGICHGANWCYNEAEIWNVLAGVAEWETAVCHEKGSTAAISTTAFALNENMVNDVAVGMIKVVGDSDVFVYDQADNLVFSIENGEIGQDGLGISGIFADGVIAIADCNIAEHTVKIVGREDAKVQYSLTTYGTDKTAIQTTSYENLVLPSGTVYESYYDKSQGKVYLTGETGETIAADKEVLGADILKIESVILEPSSINLNIGESVQVQAQIIPINATNAIVAWSSSDENIVTVDKEGKITASAAGKATIYCSAIDGSGAAGSCQVTVLDDTSSSFSGTVTSYGADDTITLELTNGTDIYTTTTVGGNQTAAEFAFTETIPAGEYTLTVKKAGHAGYTEAITIGTEPLIKEVMIYLLNDVNGDGAVTAADMQRIYTHMNGSELLTDEFLTIADANGDGTITAADMQWIYVAMNNRL